MPSAAMTPTVLRSAAVGSNGGWPRRGLLPSTIRPFVTVASICCYFVGEGQSGWDTCPWPAETGVAAWDCDFCCRGRPTHCDRFDRRFGRSIDVLARHHPVALEICLSSCCSL